MWERNESKQHDVWQAVQLLQKDAKYWPWRKVQLGKYSNTHKKCNLYCLEKNWQHQFINLIFSIDSHLIHICYVESDRLNVLGLQFWCYDWKVKHLSFNSTRWFLLTICGMRFQNKMGGCLDPSKWLFWTLFLFFGGWGELIIAFL